MGREPDMRPPWQAKSGIDAALAYIDRHYADQVTVAKLARVAGLSVFHFIRAFDARTGTTPHRYLRNRRLDQAADLLVRTAAPITEIVADVGFQSVGTFSRTFRDRFGESPSAHRAKRRRGAYIPTCFIRMYRADR